MRIDVIQRDNVVYGVVWCAESVTNKGKLMVNFEIVTGTWSAYARFMLVGWWNTIRWRR